MSFFKKLKDRMFKSSSKLDAGLEAIIEEGAGAGARAARNRRGRRPWTCPSPDRKTPAARPGLSAVSRARQRPAPGAGR